VALLAAALGCGGRAAPPEDAAAAEAARAYHEALLRQDWAGAYALLHPDSRARLSAEQFARLGQAQRRRLRFEPAAVHVRSCTVQGEEAIAHVAFTGRDAARYRRYKDAVALRRCAEGWRVVLPAQFGREAGQ
jgi:hypothetical protein